ncbi:MAG: hypothetical protein AAF383_21305 [Cyanobacteria bacterium P01_A01_bin.83]
MAYLYTTSETVKIRQKIIDNYALPIVKSVFEKYPQINSAYFSVAQYSSDNAFDEVHDFFLYSVLNTPDWEAYARSEQEEEDFDTYEEYKNSIKDPINLPGFKEYTEDISGYSLEKSVKINFDYFNGLRGEIIAAFAPFCQEGCHQNMDYSEADTPYALFTKTNDGIKIKVVGKMIRPWFDGVRPEDDYET